MTTYLVTGCAGFIGWKVCEFLLANGHVPSTGLRTRVVGVDNFNDAYDPRLKHWRLGQIENHPNFTFHRLDICDRESLRGLFEETAIGEPWAAVINLAARAGVRQSVENPWIYFETNVTGTLNLLELCREFGVKKFVQASTSSLYGANNPRPFREDANTDGPLSPY
ncbi:MAG: GDP-mannose 4,6-dehydratase, partial [Anaerolineae bacterium]|nr:GDP-mannose 4,6-dehydratase [Anaerolineae bacterium]